MQGNEAKFDTKFVHLQGRSQFAVSIQENEIITVGNDSLLKVVDISSRNDKRSVDLDEEYYAISINQMNSEVAIGGNQNRVSIYDNKQFEKEISSFKFESKVLKISYSHNGNLLGVLLENCPLQIINLSTNKIFESKNKEQLGVNFEFSKDDKAVSEINCLGKVRIYDLESVSRIDEDNELRVQVEGECIRNLQEPIGQFEFSNLCGMSWKVGSNGGQILGLPGASVFQWVEYRTESQEIKHNASIFHQQQIILVEWLPENCLVTFSRDLGLKIWNFEQSEKLYEISIVNYIWGIRFLEERKELVYLDEGGFLGFWQVGELGKGRRKKLVVEEEEEEDPEERKRSILEEMQKKQQQQQQIEQHSEEKQIQEEDVEVQKEKQQSVNKYDKLIDFRPQDILYSSSTEWFKGRQFLKWNLTGCIIGRKENQLQYIDIEFADKQFHRNIIIMNNYQLSFGDMNQWGVILASRGREINEDEYEDENEKDETKFSHILFKPFNYFHEKEEWHYQLPENEVLPILYNFVREWNACALVAIGAVFQPICTLLEC